MHGSLQNRLYEAMTVDAPEPFVGQAATITSYTDRHAATVKSWDGKILAVTHDQVKRVDDNGLSESQTYEYTTDFNGVECHYRRAKDGRWERVFFNNQTKRWKKTNSSGLILGFREEYFDFSF
jgi:hypothetical protein